MGKPKDSPITSDVAQQICERTASAAVLEGSIASLGTQYVIGLRALWKDADPDVPILKQAKIEYAAIAKP